MDDDLIENYSCLNTSSIYKYILEHHGKEKADYFFSGYPHSINHLINSKNWTNFEKVVFPIWEKIAKELFDNDKRQWEKAGLYATMRATIGPITILVKLATFEKLYSIMEKTANQYSLIEKFKVVKIDKYSAYITFSVDEKYKNYYSITNAYYLMGTIKSIPKLRGIHNNSIDNVIRMEACFEAVENILNYINVNDYKIINKKLFISNIYYGEVVDCPKKYLIDDKKDRNVIFINKSYYYKNEPLLIEGVYYGTEICYFSLSYPKQSFLSQIFKALHFLKNYKILQEELEKQQELSKEKIRELEHEKQSLIISRNEAERRLRITEVYTRRSIVDVVEKGDDPTKYEPANKNMAILFSDIRDFTTISEKLSPLDTVNLLNSYFNKMNDCIIRLNGEIDKLIGDCIMALFFNPDNSVKSAIQMRKNLNIFNRDNKTKIKVNNGVGINFGEVVLGNIGSETKMDYTVIGDVVNSASRMEALTKYYGLPIIISEELKNS
ncbi:MAG TPA: adenylate/guanylate cyclase domain-containing protein, partial [Spirochaetota bacterium]|nr:adenylate/guanylate cyclase domain-containing protein [Spirochaetota bacterium]HRU45293.1 adenylate/guanylate cyclase domain-containing protein [Spirochaetota bacterium]